MLCRKALIFLGRRKRRIDLDVRHRMPQCPCGKKIETDGAVALLDGERVRLFCSEVCCRKAIDALPR